MTSTSTTMAQTPQITDLLVCQICFEGLEDPRMLPCSHSYCKECLEKWSRSQHRRSWGDEVVTCPLCGKGKSYRGAIENLPQDFKVNKLKDLLKDVSIRKKGGVKDSCDFCSADGQVQPAKQFCTQCSMNMCLDCATRHQGDPIFQNHECIPVSSGENKAINCQKHEGEVIRYICKTCTKPLCTFCAMHKDHTKHEKVPVSEGMQVMAPLLSDLGKIAMIKLQAIKTKMSRIRDTETQCEKSFEVAKEAIKHQTDDLIEQVQEQEGKLTMDLQKKYQKYKDDQADKIEKLEMHSAVCESLSELIQDLTVKNDTFHLLSVMDDLQDHCSTVEKMDPSISSSPVGMELEFKKDTKTLSLGEIVEKDASGSQIYDNVGQDQVSYYNSSQVRGGVATHLLWQITEHGGSSGQLRQPVSVAFLPDQNIVVTELLSMRLQYFTNTGDVHLVTGGGDLLSYGSATDSSGTVYSADAKVKSMLLYNQTGHILKTWKMPRMEIPQVLAVTKDKKIIVADRKNMNINVYSDSGKIRSTFGGSGVEDDKFSDEIKGATDSKNRIIIADSGNKVIKIFDIHGKFIQRITTAGDKSLQDYALKGICTDSQDNIYVTLHHDGVILKFSPKGEWLGVPIQSLHGLKWPVDLAIGPGGQMAVVEASRPDAHSALKLYKLF